MIFKHCENNKKKSQDFLVSSLNLFLKGNLDHSEPKPDQDAILQAWKDSPGCGWNSFNAKTGIQHQISLFELLH